MNNTMNQTLMTTSVNTTTAAFESRQHRQQLLSWTWFLPIPLILFCCVILPLLFFVDRCLLRHKHRDDDEETIMARARAIREASTRNGAHKSSLENPLTKLTRTQRKNVYTQVFKRSQHSIVVTKEFFLGSNHYNKSESEKKEQEQNQEQEQQHENKNCKKDQYVDIELGGEERERDEGTTTDNNDVSYNERSSCCQSCLRKQQFFSRNDGTCIICFEEFAVGDVIVWSEDQDCSHIYHEECMIQYLTTKRRPKEIVVTYDNDSDTDGDSTNDHSENTEETEDTTSSNNDSDSDSDDTERDNMNDNVNKDHNTIIEKNPCPTCRRTFCTVTLEDLNSVTSRGMTTEKEVSSC